MIIQLKGITFNDDVIFGKSIELSESVKALFSDKAYTRSVSDEQKAAVQTAIESLQENGLWDKIDVLYLPILAGKVDEAFINIKSTYGQGTVVKDRFISEIEEALSISENGGVNLANKTFTNWSSGISYNTTAGSFHCGFSFLPLRQSDTGYNNNSYFLVFKNSNGGLRAIGSIQLTRSGTRVLIYSNDWDNDNVQITENNTPILIGYNESGNVNSLLNMNTYSETNYIDRYPYNIEYSSVMTAYPLLTDANTMTKLNGVRFCTLGKYLTKSEMQTYSQIIKDLLSVF